MKLVGGVIWLFVYLGPLYIGYITLHSFFANKNKPITERTEICREPKLLAISIILLLLIPGELIYTTLTHVIPSGDYVLNAEYSVWGYSEVYDEDEDEYWEKEYSYEGVAPITIRIDNEVDYEDDGETFWGEPKSKTTYYTNVFLSSIKLDCFNNKEFYIDFEIESNRDYDFEIEYDDITYNLNVSIGEISDETLNYTLEDRIEGISTSTIVEYSVLMLLDIIGIVGFFMAEKIYKEENAKKVCSSE